MAELVAGEAFVLTLRGPVVAAALKPDEDDVWVVTRDGSLATARLRSISGPEKTETWRLLSGVGDLALPDATYVSTAGGRFLAGDEVAELVGRGQEVDLDVISPRDVEFPSASAAPDAQAIEAALATLTSAVLQIPVANGAAAAVATPLEAMLESARVAYRRIEDDRWLAFVLQDLPAETVFSSRAFVQQADALMLATAWEPNSSSVTSRLRLDDSHLLQCLIAALVGAGHAFEVKWTPKYSPVECRVRLLEQPAWGAFIGVDAAVRDTGWVYELDIAGSGRPILNLLVTTSNL